MEERRKTEHGTEEFYQQKHLAEERYIEEHRKTKHDAEE